ncbi:hypothetical protein ACI792_17730 [Blastococcus sp. SYSU DS0669]
MNDHETTVLRSRLTALADDMTPPLDVVGLVRDASLRHRRKRRGRLALLAVTTATAAVAAGTVVAVDALTADRGQEVARPTPVRTSTPPPPVSATPAAEPTAPVTGWEIRTFEGVTFEVPPGARAADTIDPGPAPSLFDGPSLTWNGPRLGGDVYAEVQITQIETYEGGLYPADGGDWFTVAGADAAYGGVDAASRSDGAGAEVATTSVWLYLLDGDRQFRVSALLPGGDTGVQMAERVVASLAVTPAAVEEDPGGAHQPSTAWESRTVQDITFSVPPGSSAPEHRTDSTLIWYGPQVDGQATFLTLDVTPLLPGQSVGDGYARTTVPGTQEAWVMTDLGTMNPGIATFTVWMHDGRRSISLGGTLPLGPGSEETMRRVVESVVVG